MKYFDEAMTAGATVKPVYPDALRSLCAGNDAMGLHVAAFRYRGYVISFTSQHDGAAIVWRDSVMIALFDNPEIAIHKINRALDRIRSLSQLLTESTALPDTFD